MKRVGGAGLVREGAAAGLVIGVYVRVDHAHDAHPLRIRELRVCVDIVQLWIDHDAHALAAAAEHVRGATRIEAIERSEDHESVLLGDCDGESGQSPPASAAFLNLRARPIPQTAFAVAPSTGSPAARHSGYPSSSRRTLKPRARSNATAS